MQDTLKLNRGIESGLSSVISIANCFSLCNVFTGNFKQAFSHLKHLIQDNLEQRTGLKQAQNLPQRLNDITHELKASVW